MSYPVSKAKSLGKQLVNNVVDMTGLFERRIKQLESEPCWIVITYHRVLDDYAKDPFALGMVTQKQDFKAQMQLLKQHFDIRQANDVIAATKAGETLNKPTVSITFDDGYLDNLNNALPILQELQLQATLYVATGGLDTAQMLWWDRVIYAIHQSSANTLDVRNLDITGCDSPLELSPPNKKRSVETLLDGLWTTDLSRCMRAVDAIEDQLNVTTNQHWAPRMSSEQLRSFQQAGMEIGAHSIHHHDMSQLDQTRLQQELSESKSTLETLLDKPVTGFAYPAGRHSEVVIESTRAAGYEYAMSTIRGFNHSPIQNQYAIQRMVIGDNDVKDFKRCFAELAGNMR